MNDTTYHSADNAHYIFVELLEKYKVLLRSAKSPIINRRKYAAANALVDQYNKKCVRKTTVRKVFKKIANMKTRLKEKNFKNLSRKKKLEYLDWEQKFLDIWVGNGITVLPNKVQKSSDVKSRPADELDDFADMVQTETMKEDEITPKLNQSDEIYITSDIRAESENHTNSIPDSKIKLENRIPEECKIKIEVDDDFLQNGSQFSTVNSPHFSEAYSKPDMRCTDDGDEDDKYENMTLDELKRFALIAQIKNIKEQEAAARAKKELKLYKLLSLRRENGNPVE